MADILELTNFARDCLSRTITLALKLSKAVHKRVVIHVHEGYVNFDRNYPSFVNQDTGLTYNKVHNEYYLLSYAAMNNNLHYKTFLNLVNYDTRCRIEHNLVYVQHGDRTIQQIWKDNVRPLICYSSNSSLYSLFYTLMGRTIKVVSNDSSKLTPDGKPWSLSSDVVQSSVLKLPNMLNIDTNLVVPPTTSIATAITTDSFNDRIMDINSSKLKNFKLSAEDLKDWVLISEPTD